MAAKRIVVRAVESLGRRPTDIRHIIVTHCRPDHAGSLAAIKRLTNAPVYMHAVDAAMVRTGEGRRPMTAAPGLLRTLMYDLFVARSSSKIEPCTIDYEITDGTELPIAGGYERSTHQGTVPGISRFCGRPAVSCLPPTPPALCRTLA